MFENLKRFREPVTIVVMLAMVASMVIGLVRLGLELTAQRAFVPAAFQDIANSFMNLTLVVLLVVLVLGCFLVPPRTRHAKTISAWAAFVVTTGTILTLVATLIGLSASAGVFGVILEFLGGLLDILIKAVAAGSLWLVWNAARTGRLEPPRAWTPPAPAAPAEPEAPAPEPATDAADPVWQAHEASGSVWRSAADAAAGEPAAGHGVAGPGSGAWIRPDQEAAPGDSSNRA